jgi:KEOPS complex subunit Pcc1
MKRSAVIRLTFPTEKLAETLLKAILPETKKPTTSRSRVTIECEGKKITIRIEAEDTSALRSTINSYLRWVTLAKDTYEAAANLETLN